MLLIVSYDLFNPAKNLKKVVDVFKRASQAWWNDIQHTWILDTPYSPEELFESLKPFLVKSDKVLFFELTHNYQGWLPDKAWDWIRDRIVLDRMRSAGMQQLDQMVANRHFALRSQKRFDQ